MNTLTHDQKVAYAACENADEPLAGGAPGDYSGRLKNSEILAGVPKNYVKAKRTGHNEVTRWYADGSSIVRYHLTDIVTRFASGIVLVDNGGWPTVSTRRHINDALAAAESGAFVYQSMGRQVVGTSPIHGWAYDRSFVICTDGHIIPDVQSSGYRVVDCGAAGLAFEPAA